ncbi:hypothetical protein ACHAWF_015491 [Thalassiosira exigua]
MSLKYINATRSVIVEAHQQSPEPDRGGRGSRPRSTNTMSLMTESLLLQAQSLRLEGELDASIDLLRTVLSQCASDLRARRDGRAAASRDGDGGGGDGGGDADDLRGCDGVGGPSHFDDDVARGLGRTAAYQLALLLLQRDGRRRHGNSIARARANDDDEGSTAPGTTDEIEADRILWELGYRLRLSSLALGYPLRGYRSQSGGAPRLPLSIIDDALPTSMFGALQRAFRPESRYWSEFYGKAHNAKESDLHQKQDVESEGVTSLQRRNQFASHNIPLPCCETSSSSFRFRMQRANSILEQVAIIAQNQLKERFPDLVEATSIEVWSHRRPPDGQHQLHYDMDEILLWKRRQRFRQKTEGQNDAESNQQEVGTKRRKVNCGGYEKSRPNNGTMACKDIGVSCPIVSCVLTIEVPNQSGAPTLVCDQSITRGDVSNSGCLCYPRPNRLLAFEGSLLHGVVPGIPFAQCSDEHGGSSDDDSCDLDSRKSNRMPARGGDQRVTLMMGFWREVCLTEPSKTTKGSQSVEIGPNVPYGSSCASWTEDFLPIPVGIDMSDLATNRVHGIVQVIDPLWVPIREARAIAGSGGTNPCEEIHLEKCSTDKRFHGRFFLRSLKTKEIDKEVLQGQY